MLLPTAALRAATTLAASTLAVGAVAGLSYAADSDLGADPAVEASPEASAGPTGTGAPEVSAGTSATAVPDASPSPEQEEAAASAAPTATAPPGPTTAASPSQVPMHASNVRVTANDGTSTAADGSVWTVAPSVKVNLRGRATVADVVVGMRVHLTGWSADGALTVEHVVVPRTPENRALQRAARGGAGDAVPPRSGPRDKGAADKGAADKGAASKGSADRSARGGKKAVPGSDAAGTSVAPRKGGPKGRAPQKPAK